jgi:hypothetical protein
MQAQRCGCAAHPESVTLGCSGVLLKRLFLVFASEPPKSFLESFLASLLTIIFNIIILATTPPSSACLRGSLFLCQSGVVLGCSHMIAMLRPELFLLLPSFVITVNPSEATRFMKRSGVLSSQFSPPDQCGFRCDVNEKEWIIILAVGGPSHSTFMNCICLRARGREREKKREIAIVLERLCVCVRMCVFEREREGESEINQVRCDG